MPMLGKKPAFDALGAMTGQDTPTPALSWQDRAKIFLAALNGDYAGAEKLKHEPLVQAQQRAFLAQLSGAMKGAPAQYQDGPGPSVAAPGLPTAPGMEDAGGAMAAVQKALAPGPAQAAPGFQYQPPQMTAPAKPGLNINSPELASLALRGQLVGVPLTNMLDVMKAQQPDVHYDRGFGSDAKTGKPMGAYHPDLEKGQIPLYGPDGTLQGVKNIDGSVQAAADLAGATEAAKAKAQAPYQSVQTQDETGRPVTTNALDLASRVGGGKPFVGQSPAQTAADTEVAKAGANANINLPQTLSGAAQTIGVIEALKSHPALSDRTGWRGFLPAVPGTPGADFDALSAQLKGKLFLEAYGGLKGGGQITEIEGKKATEAMARLNQSQTKEGYLHALQDLEDVINAGATRASQQPGRLQPNASSGGPTKAAARPAISQVPLNDRLAEARRRGLIK